MPFLPPGFLPDLPSGPGPGPDTPPAPAPASAAASASVAAGRLARFLRDTVIVYPPTDGADADAGPTQGDGAGAIFAAAVQKAGPTGRSDADGTIRGTEVYNVLFAADPGVTRADWRIAWTANAYGTFATPIWLSSQGAAEPPGGIAWRWTVSAVRRS